MTFDCEAFEGDLIETHLQNLSGLEDPCEMDHYLFSLLRGLNPRQMNPFAFIPLCPVNGFLQRTTSDSDSELEILKDRFL